MDLFAGLDGLGSAPNKKASLAEQRKIQETHNRNVVQAFDGLDLLGSSLTPSPASSTTGLPSRNSSKPPPAAPQPAAQTQSEDDDLFGIFSSAPTSAKKASTPQPQPSVQQESSKPHSNRAKPTPHYGDRFSDEDEFEPYHGYRESSGSSKFANSRSTRSTPQTARSSPQPSITHDRGVAQLIEMGFEEEDSRRSLQAMNGSVRGAVNWLMAEAQGLPLPTPKKSGIASTLGANDFTEFQAAASQIGASMFSKASSLFAKGRKELEKAYNQYNHQGSDSRGSLEKPAWMKDKAKYDARRPVAADPELPTRPQRRDIQRQTDADTYKDSSSSAGARHSGSNSSSSSGASPAVQRPSRAELFRQRQKSRNGSGNITPASPSVSHSVASSPAVSAVNILENPAESPSAPITPDIDLLNLSGSNTAGSSGGGAVQASLSSTEKDMYQASRELGSEAYRKGNYEDAAEHYTAALQVIPEKNVLRALIFSNRSAAYLKAGNLRGAFDDTSAGIALIPGRGSSKELDDKGTSMADIWVKLVTRNAQAAESMEKFEAALKSWQLLLDNGHATPPVLDAKRRCLRALNPETIAKQEAPPTPKPKTQRRGWGTTGAVPTSAEGKAALEKVKANHNKQLDEERQKDMLRDKVSARVTAWSQGNEKNLRVLLSTLQNVLWESSGWTPVGLSDLVVPKKVRVVYMKAVAKTHPDKVSSSAPVEVRMISESVFVVIQAAWEVFRQENNL